MISGQNTQSYSVYGPLNNDLKYSGHRLMGSLWDKEKLIPIAD